MDGIAICVHRLPGKLNTLPQICRTSHKHCSGRLVLNWVMYVYASNPHQTRTTVHGRFCSVGSGIQSEVRRHRWLRQTLRTPSKFGERCFSYTGPAACNSLPRSIELTTDTNRFKELLKSHVVHVAFCHFVSAPGQFLSHILQVRICFCLHSIRHIENRKK